jgi:hypothetical protein
MPTLSLAALPYARAPPTPAAPTCSASRAQLQRWACYFHLRIADALASQADSQGAAAAAERGLGVARSAGLAVEEVRPGPS